VGGRGTLGPGWWRRARLREAVRRLCVAWGRAALRRWGEACAWAAAAPAAHRAGRVAAPRLAAVPLAWPYAHDVRLSVSAHATTSHLGGTLGASARRHSRGLSESPRRCCSYDQRLCKGRTLVVESVCCGVGRAAGGSSLCCAWGAGEIYSGSRRGARCV
jgi:hypothetical protein